MATPNKIEIPREYWAFRLGRLIAQLPRMIEYAFFHDSALIESTAYYEPQPHVGDRFPYMERVFSELQETITELRDNGASNLRKAAEDALKSLKELEELIMDSLQNGASIEVAEHLSELQDICQPQPGAKYDDSPLTDFVAKFRGDEGGRRLEKRGPGRPRKNQDTVSENHFPLRSDSWKNFNKASETLKSRLGKASVFFNVGEALDQSCDKWFLKSKPPHDTKSNSQFNREVRRAVEEQLSIVSDLGVDVTKLPAKDSSGDSFETQLYKSIREIEDQLRCAGSDLTASQDLLPEFRTMKSLTWDEITITIRNERSCDELLSESNVFAAAESRFSISARSENVVYTATELHLVKASSPDRAKQSLMTLLKFARCDGQITWGKSKEISMHHSVEGTISETGRLPVDKKHIQELRNELIRIFGIDDAPISKYNKKNGYELHCTIFYEQTS